MRRIMVIGCSGSGKSTFARKLAAKTGLPVVHIDQLFWHPGWVEAPKDQFLKALTAATATDSWVMDGLNVSSFDLRVPRAHAIVWYRFARWRCLLRVVRRVLSSYGRVRVDMAPGCPERFDWDFMVWIWNFERDYLPRIEAALTAHDAWDRTTIVRNDREGEAILRKLARQIVGVDLISG